MTHTDAVRSLAVERYLLEEMSEIERFAFEEHFFACAECADDVRAGAALRRAVGGGALGGRAPSRASSPWRAAAARPAWRAAVALPWAAAATLALVVGYQSLSPAPGRLPVQALAPVTLRADSRGEVPRVPWPAAPNQLTLALDVDAPAGRPLAFELQTSAGVRVAEGRVAAPAAGAPLLVLVPAWTLTPSTEYSLAVRTADGGEPLGSYRFAVDAR